MRKIAVHWLDDPTHDLIELEDIANYCELLRRENSNTLGFFPNCDIRFKRAAQIGRLVIATGGDAMLAGYLFFGLNFKRRTLRIQQIVVARSLRRQGIGRSMFCAVLDRCRDQIDAVALRCRDGMEAVEFWRHLGFAEIATREHVGTRGKAVREYLLPLHKEQ